MPKITVTDETHQLILAPVRAPLMPRSGAVRRPDGLWEVPVDDEVAMAIEAGKLTGETDDQVVSRLVRKASRCQTKLRQC